MCSTAAVGWICLSGVAVPAARVLSLSIYLHLFIACIVWRAIDVLKFCYLASVDVDPLVPGLLVNLECASFWVQGGLRVHVGLVDENALASLLEEIMFPSCRGGCVHSKSAADCVVTEADYLVSLLVDRNDGSRRCLENITTILASSGS